jgi:hypothetical protein
MCTESSQAGLLVFSQFALLELHRQFAKRNRAATTRLVDLCL